MPETEIIQLFDFFLQDVTFAKVYNSAPPVFVSANHSTKNGSQSPIHNSIAELVVVWFDLFIYFYFYEDQYNTPSTCSVRSMKTYEDMLMTICNAFNSVQIKPQKVVLR